MASRFVHLKNRFVELGLRFYGSGWVFVFVSRINGYGPNDGVSVCADGLKRPGNKLNNLVKPVIENKGLIVTNKLVPVSPA